MIDVSASEGWLGVTLRVMTLVQMCVQGRWVSDSSLLTLPYMEDGYVAMLSDALSQSRRLRGHGLDEIACLAELLLASEANLSFVREILGRTMGRPELKQVPYSSHVWYTAMLLLMLMFGGTLYMCIFF